MIAHKEQIIDYFKSGIRETKDFKIGIEHEKFLFVGKEKKRVDYEQIKKIFKNLETFGWSPVYEKKKIIGLKRDKQQITTEPGLQYELSGAPLKNIHLVCSESSTHFNEITEASKDLSINTVSIGFYTFNNLSEVPKNPEARSQIMTKEMPKGGELSLQMMYQTSGIQINYDYTSEKNFEKKFPENGIG